MQASGLVVMVADDQKPVARHHESRSSGGSPKGRKGLLLLRLGTRPRVDGPDDELLLAKSGLQLLVGGNDRNSRGVPLSYATHSFRPNVEHVPHWVRHCRSVLDDRRGRENMHERQQVLIAMGFFAHTIMRRWRRWARRDAGLRRLFEKLSVADAVRRWKEGVRHDALGRILRRQAMWGALQRWKGQLKKLAAYESANIHYSRNLVATVWNAWLTHRSNAASDHRCLREAIKHWRAWQMWWKKHVECSHQLLARRALASSLCRWHLVVSARCDRRRRRLEAAHFHEALLSRKALLVLAKNSQWSVACRRLLKRLRLQALRCGFGAWQRWLCLFQTDQERPKEALGGSRESEVCQVSRCHEFCHPGKPRKGHCRCVYDVCKRQRSTCTPSSHLLRRVEELHRLVANGLDAPEGGYSGFNHVVQRAANLPGKRVRSSGKPSQLQGVERRGDRTCTHVQLAGGRPPCDSNSETRVTRETLAQLPQTGAPNRDSLLVGGGAGDSMPYSTANVAMKSAGPPVYSMEEQMRVPTSRFGHRGPRYTHARDRPHNAPRHEHDMTHW